MLRKLASQTMLYGFTYIAGRLLNYALTPFYTRYFTDTAEYGIMTLIYAYLTFFNILYTYGMETGYFYFSNKKEEENAPVGGTSFLSLLFTSVIISGILVIFSPQLAALIGFPGRADYIIYAALILFFDTLSVIPFAYLRKVNRAASFAILRLLSIVLNIIFNLFFLVLCPYILSAPDLAFLHPLIDWIYTPGYGVGYVFISNVLASAFVLIFLLPEVRKFKLKWDGSLWKRMFRYSWPLLILGFAGMINETLDRILLQYKLTDAPMSLSPYEAKAQIGIYSACYKLSIFMTLAIQSFRYAAEPFFFAQMKEAGTKLIYARILKYFSFATGLIFLAVTLFLPILILIIGKPYREAMDVVPVLLLANLFLGIFVYLSQWYKQTEKTIYGAYISIGGAVITLLINFIFIPYYGYWASAWATLICYFSMAVVSYFLGQKFYPVPYQTGRIAMFIFGAVFLYAVSYLIENYIFDGWHLAMYLINTILLFIYLWLFIYLEKPDFSFVKKAISRKS